MNFPKQKALSCAVKAAQAAGILMRQNLRSAKTINSQSQHDIKLELDVRCQNLIEKILHRDFPEVGFLGEEGGDSQAEYRWVVDPIDGTVNFSYEIPHCCVSIALQKKCDLRPAAGGKTGKNRATRHPSHVTLVGVVYDPFCNELWTAKRGGPARLNGKIIRVSKRNQLSQAIVSIGLGKTKKSIEATLPYLNQLLRRVRKVRMMGAAALAMVYVASGRFDGYVEQHFRLWDIAAGGLILECAGGEFWNRQIEGEHSYRVLATNGLVRRQLEKLR